MRVHGYGRVDVTPWVNQELMKPVSVCALHIPALQINFFSVQRYCRLSRQNLTIEDKLAVFTRRYEEETQLAAYVHPGLYRILFGYRMLVKTELSANVIGTYEFKWPDARFDAWRYVWPIDWEYRKHGLY